MVSIWTSDAGRILGVVGESGSGKSSLALCLLRLLPANATHLGGQILFDGADLVALGEEGMAAFRGKRVAMIFQDPMTALNPLFTIGTHLVDVLRRRQTDLTRTQAMQRAQMALQSVGISDAALRLKSYPHELSGGMRQRVMIAMALSCSPKLLVADEPTTALDVTTEAQVLEQIKALQAEFRMAVILVTHDLGVVAETCKRAVVMYCGSIVESGTTAELFSHPRHPYTAGLLASIPRLRSERLAELPVIPGRVPDLRNLPAGCRFADRCPRVQERCRVERPLLATGDYGGEVACHFPL